MRLDGNTRQILEKWQAGEPIEPIAEIGKALGMPDRAVGLVIMDRRLKKDRRANRRQITEYGKVHTPGAKRHDEDEELLGKLWHERAMSNVHDGKGKGVPFDSLPKNGCQWPVGEQEGETLFCGEPQEPPAWAKFTRKYCAHHSQRAATPGDQVAEGIVRIAVASGRAK